MQKQSIEFSYQVPAEAFDIVISEILCDPTPSLGLPEYDYLEIYNRSDNPFYLNDWLLSFSLPVAMQIAVFTSGDLIGFDIKDCLWSIARLEKLGV